MNFDGLAGKPPSPSSKFRRQEVGFEACLGTAHTRTFRVLSSCTLQGRRLELRGRYLLRLRLSLSSRQSNVLFSMAVAIPGPHLDGGGN